MIRNLFAVSLCAATLVVGVLTSSLSSKNRVRENGLDHMQRLCEAELRKNQHFRADNARAQWALLSGVEEGSLESQDDPSEPTVFFVDI
jgi:hypothetical protein